MNGIINSLHARKSVRGAFTGDAVPPELKRAVLEAAVQARLRAASSSIPFWISLTRP